jgi:hypothetical protein
VAGGGGRTLRLLTVDRPAIARGDPVEFLPFEGQRPPNAVAVSLEPSAEPMTSAEEAFIGKLRMVEKVRARFLNGRVKAYSLTVDRDVALPQGSAVCSAMRVGNGFAVKDCNFGDNRSRGILIKASDGEISGNRIVKSRMAAVLISPEFQWMEAACSSDVVVKDNVIREIGETSIRVLAPGGNGRPLPAGTHRNISILNNRIENSPWPLIEVTSTAGLVIDGNVLPTEPIRGKTRGPRVAPLVPIQLENCDTAKAGP